MTGEELMSRRMRKLVIWLVAIVAVVALFVVLGAQPTKTYQNKYDGQNLDEDTTYDDYLRRYAAALNKQVAEGA